MKRFLLAAACTALLSSSVALKADDDKDKHRERAAEQRYYDPYSKDYHNWDSREDEAWRAYLNNNHREYREFNRMSKRDQQRYFKWRHEHHDDHDRDHHDH